MGNCVSGPIAGPPAAICGAQNYGAAAATSQQGLCELLAQIQPQQGPVATRFLKDKLDSVDHAVIVALPTRSLANPVYDVLEGGSSTAQQQGSYLKLFYANAAARQAIGSLDAWLDKHFTLENWVLFSDVLRRKAVPDVFTHFVSAPSPVALDLTACQIYAYKSSAKPQTALIIGMRAPPLASPQKALQVEHHKLKSGFDSKKGSSAAPLGGIHGAPSLGGLGQQPQFQCMVFLAHLPLSVLVISKTSGRLIWQNERSAKLLGLANSATEGLHDPTHSLRRLFFQDWELLDDLIETCSEEKATWSGLVQLSCNVDKAPSKHTGAGKQTPILMESLDLDALGIPLGKPEFETSLKALPLSSDPGGAQSAGQLFLKTDNKGDQLKSPFADAPYLRASSISIGGHENAPSPEHTYFSDTPKGDGVDQRKLYAYARHHSSVLSQAEPLLPSPKTARRHSCVNFVVPQGQEQKQDQSSLGSSKRAPSLPAALPIRGTGKQPNSESSPDTRPPLLNSELSSFLLASIPSCHNGEQASNHQDSLKNNSLFSKDYSVPLDEAHTWQQVEAYTMEGSEAEQLLVVTFQDVSHWVAVQERLKEVLAIEHTLLSDILPSHVIEGRVAAGTERIRSTRKSRTTGQLSSSMLKTQTSQSLRSRQESMEITDSCCNNALSSDNKVEAKIQATALRVGDCKETPPLGARISRSLDFPSRAAASAARQSASQNRMGNIMDLLYGKSTSGTDAKTELKERRASCVRSSKSFSAKSTLDDLQLDSVLAGNRKQLPMPKQRPQLTRDQSINSTSELITKPSMTFNDDRTRKALPGMGQHHENVTVLFADIRNFTNMSRKVDSATVMAFLHKLFCEFNALVEEREQQGVYKVETIGDCYMIAAGLLTRTEFGATRRWDGPTTGPGSPVSHLFELAKDMLSAAERMEMPASDGQPVILRIGMHTGAVTSGVAGRKCPRFCLFGDTVNFAARMESNCEPSCVHVSSDTWQALGSLSLGGDTGWHATEGVDAKGIGFVQTYVYRRPTNDISAASEDPNVKADKPCPAVCSNGAGEATQGQVTAFDPICVDEYLAHPLVS